LFTVFYFLVLLFTIVNIRDTLAPYPWSCSFGWCPAEG